MAALPSQSSLRIDPQSSLADGRAVLNSTKPSEWARRLVRGAYDLHVHVEPDVMRRQVTDLDAANHRAKHAELPPGATPPMWLALQRTTMIVSNSRLLAGADSTDAGQPHPGQPHPGQHGDPA